MLLVHSFSAACHHGNENEGNLLFSTGIVFPWAFFLFILLVLIIMLCFVFRKRTFPLANKKNACTQVFSVLNFLSKHNYSRGWGEGKEEQATQNQTTAHPHKKRSKVVLKHWPSRARYDWEEEKSYLSTIMVDRKVGLPTTPLENISLLPCLRRTIGKNVRRSLPFFYISLLLNCPSTAPPPTHYKTVQKRTTKANHEWQHRPSHHRKDVWFGWGETILTPPPSPSPSRFLGPGSGSGNGFHGGGSGVCEKKLSIVIFPPVGCRRSRC